MRENRGDVRGVGLMTAIACVGIGLWGAVSGGLGLLIMAAVSVGLLFACGVLRIGDIRADAHAAQARVRAVRVGPEGMGAFRDNVSTGSRGLGKDVRAGLREIRKALRGGSQD